VSAEGATTIVIIEDQAAVREGLITLVGSAPGFACTGGFESVDDALAQLHEAPGIILMDLGLPGTPGIEGIALLRARFSETPILVLSVFEDDDRIFRALCAGACGYLTKKTPPERILDAVRDALAGGGPMSPEVARRVIMLFREFGPPRAAAHDLTPHELRLLKMLVEGHSFRTAAERLGVTANTISFHVRNIYRKLEVHSRAEVVAKALRQGLVR
jgi:DNA-binding NarL/FixJ family response regulator